MVKDDGVYMGEQGNPNYLQNPLCHGGRDGHLTLLWTLMDILTDFTDGGACSCLQRGSYKAITLRRFMLAVTDGTTWS